MHFIPIQNIPSIPRRSGKSQFAHLKDWPVEQNRLRPTWTLGESPKRLEVSHAAINRPCANRVWKRVGSRDSYNRIKPPTNIAAGGHSAFGFVVVQIAGGVNELVADIVVGPAKAIPQLWIIVEKPTAGEGRD